MGFTDIYHRNELMISSKGSWSTTTTTTTTKKPSNKHLYSISKLSIKTKIQNHCFSIYFDAIIYQPRQKNKTHHCFLIYYSAIIYAISIYRFFTSFQFINLSNLKILVIVLCVSNMGQQTDNLEGNGGPNIKIKKKLWHMGARPYRTPLGLFQVCPQDIH